MPGPENIPRYLEAGNPLKPSYSTVAEDPRHKVPVDGTIPSNGYKTDNGKDRWDLLPFRALREVTKVMTSGLKKYPEWNWLNVPNKKNRYFAAAMRHLVSWRTGETHDPETGLHHLAHASCCVLFLLHAELSGPSENATE